MGVALTDERRDALCAARPRRTATHVHPRAGTTTYALTDRHTDVKHSSVSSNTARTYGERIYTLFESPSIMWRHNRFKLPGKGMILIVWYRYSRYTPQKLHIYYGCVKTKSCEAKTELQRAKRQEKTCCNQGTCAGCDVGVRNCPHRTSEPPLSKSIAPSGTFVREVLWLLHVKTS